MGSYHEPGSATRGHWYHNLLGTITFYRSAGYSVFRLVQGLTNPQYRVGHLHALSLGEIIGQWFAVMSAIWEPGTWRENPVSFMIRSQLGA